MRRALTTHPTYCDVDVRKKRIKKKKGVVVCAHTIMLWSRHGEKRGWAPPAHLPLGPGARLWGAPPPPPPPLNMGGKFHHTQVQSKRFRHPEKKVHVPKKKKKNRNFLCEIFFFWLGRFSIFLEKTHILSFFLQGGGGV